MSKENTKPTFDLDGTTYHEGQRVSVMVSFFGGPPRRISGELIRISKAEAYIDTSFGVMVGKAETLEDE